MPWASSSTAATGPWFNLYDRRSNVSLYFRADRYWHVTHIVGEVDPYSAVGGTSPSVLVTVDVVAGQVHRCCPGGRIHAERSWAISKAAQNTDRTDRNN